MGAKYIHQAITTERQIGILKERGLLINDVEKAVAREFGLKHHKFLRSWLECLAVLRNCCAHHSRLSNRVFPVKPKMPECMPNTWIVNFSFRKQSLYPQLCCVVYWFNSIVPENTFVADFKQLLVKHPSVNTHLLGFPYNWEQEPLWR
ncbi:Abi family protein [uncultured Parabacteroides sp.]|uniref:Abi family protein n=1 Tax=uncultured Parabacteroides sp. TaxID=512312 RepID=UPI00260AE334|nr:Abi family protein [uncultured Parabacteroides sp.]